MRIFRRGHRRIWEKEKNKNRNKLHQFDRTHWISILFFRLFFRLRALYMRIIKLTTHTILTVMAAAAESQVLHRRIARSETICREVGFKRNCWMCDRMSIAYFFTLKHWTCECYVFPILNSDVNRLHGNGVGKEIEFHREEKIKR